MSFTVHGCAQGESYSGSSQLKRHGSVMLQKNPRSYDHVSLYKQQLNNMLFSCLNCVSPALFALNVHIRPLASSGE